MAKLDPGDLARLRGFKVPASNNPMQTREDDLKRVKRRPKERELNIKQVPFRMHRHDYDALKKTLDGDGWSFQAFVTAMAESYIRRDPLVIKVMADWREEAEIKKYGRAGETLSGLERRGILDELEAMDPLEEE